MTAQLLDGTATAAAIKGELRDRVAALAERGIVPRRHGQTDRFANACASTEIWSPGVAAAKD